jgi:predicted AAA+ superfamily ATPase
MRVVRSYFQEKLRAGLRRSPVVVILGPRQCGKTTLVKDFLAGQENVTFFDLSRESDFNALQNPILVLEKQTGIVVIDEAQLQPKLFEALKVLVDKDEERKTKYIVLGSASPVVRKKTSETLAGRIAFVDLSGFLLLELPHDRWEDLWLRGGFPLSFLAEDEANSLAWREDFIRTFFERDIPQLGIKLSPLQLRRFWSLLAHYHGQEMNTMECANALGISHVSVRNYLCILCDAFILRPLSPWFENIQKRQVKRPKIYFRDSGLLHFFLRVNAKLDLYANPKNGASFEGFVLEQVMNMLGERNVFFWKLHSGAKIDGLIHLPNKRIGIEIKLTEAPVLSKSLYSAVDDLHLDEVWIVCPCDKLIYLKENVKVVPINVCVRELMQNFPGTTLPP